MPAKATDLSQLLATPVNHRLHEPLHEGNLKYTKAIDYLRGEDTDDKLKSCDDVFASGMPGAMSVEELQTQIDLGAWLIQIEDQLVMIEVCRLDMYLMRPK